MRKRFNLIIMVICLVAATGCKEKTYFNGNISFYEDFVGTDTLYGTKIDFIDDIQTGNMIVHDSIMLFYSSLYKDYEFLACNTNTGKNIGFLCRKGGGPDEFGAVSFSKQLIVDNNETKLWLMDYLRKKMRLLNISKSLKENTTIIDTTINMECLKDFSNFCSWTFMLDSVQLLVKNQSELLYVNREKYLPGRYHIYNGAEKLKEFKLYNDPLINPNSQSSMDMLHSCDRIKPDNSKVVMGMMCLSQISILDLNTGNLNGFRKENSIDFNDLRKQDLYDMKTYYGNIEVDNNYIFGMYANKLNSDEFFDYTKEIHVFDWEGKAVKRLIFEQEFDIITLDSKNKKLYLKNVRDEVYCYDIAYLYN